ncbi:tescalcin a isoform X1 [Siphateles boraxobius]|uniref:tescalcin a isoform X1 n=1 Tax=Siphateles boraxobius TaxID=180520 RepID=UPI0040643588
MTTDVRATGLLSLNSVILFFLGGRNDSGVFEATGNSSSDLLKIFVKMGASWSAQTFKQAGETPSGPDGWQDGECRNLGQREKGCLQEIGFKEFVTVLAFFKPPKPHIAEEERKAIKKEKLRFLFNMHDTDNDGIITLDEYKRVVEELLSSTETIGVETAKAISDAAMLEVASETVGQMGPDEFYEGITFEQFMQILKDIEIETKMNIHFWNLETMQCGK